MTSPIARPLTIEEFDRLDLPEDREWELQDGEVVAVTLPAFKHRLLQNRLLELLRPLFQSAMALEECPFQVGKHDKRSADVAVIANDRARTAAELDILDGAPDMVIEVLGPLEQLSEAETVPTALPEEWSGTFLGRGSG